MRITQLRVVVRIIRAYGGENVPMLRVVRMFQPLVDENVRAYRYDNIPAQSGQIRNCAISPKDESHSDAFFRREILQEWL